MQKRESIRHELWLGEEVKVNNVHSENRTGSNEMLLPYYIKQLP